MIERHPFIYFLPDTTEKLIIGSFPCFNGKDYGDWFYCGSGKSEFWRLLSGVFDLPTDTTEAKQHLCSHHKIALTDIAFCVERTKNNCADTNLRIIEFNRTGIDLCLSQKPAAIYFTSRFVERHFRKLYPEVTVRSYVLASPSPAANRHIAGLIDYKQLRANNTISSPYDYRLIKYRQILLDNP